jgi:hypothetical protein
MHFGCPVFEFCINGIEHETGLPLFPNFPSCWVLDAWNMFDRRWSGCSVGGQEHSHQISLPYFPYFRRLGDLRVAGRTRPPAQVRLDSPICKSSNRLNDCIDTI